MSFSKYIGIIAAFSLIGWIGFFLVLTQLEPCTAPGEVTICHAVAVVPLALLFLSAFFALSSTFTLMGLGLRYWFNSQEIYLDHLGISLRQAILLTLCSLAAFALLLLQALTWWSGFLLILVILFLELYFARGS